jgi:hypothetical protein
VSKLAWAFGEPPAEHYVVAVECGNCYRSMALTARKGMLVEAALRAEVCLNCGCGELHKAPPQRGRFFEVPA